MQEILITTALWKYSWLYDKNTSRLHIRQWLAHETIFRTERQAKNIRSLCIHLFHRRVLTQSITVLWNGPFDVPCIEVAQNFISTFHFNDLASSHVNDVKFSQHQMYGMNLVVQRQIGLWRKKNCQPKDAVPFFCDFSASSAVNKLLEPRKAAKFVTDWVEQLGLVAINGNLLWAHFKVAISNYNFT